MNWWVLSIYSFKQLDVLMKPSGCACVCYVNLINCLTLVDGVVVTRVHRISCCVEPWGMFCLLALFVYGLRGALRMIRYGLAVMASPIQSILRNVIMSLCVCGPAGVCVCAEQDININSVCLTSWGERIVMTTTGYILALCEACGIYAYFGSFYAAFSHHFQPCLFLLPCEMSCGYNTDCAC